MDREAAVKLWRLVANGAPGGVVTGRALEAFATAVEAAKRDCRTCKNWTPHHRSDVMHCSAALRCVAGSSYRRQGMVQLWEVAPVDAGF